MNLLFSIYDRGCDHIRPPLLYVFYTLRPFRPSIFDHMLHYGGASVVDAVRCSPSGVQLDYTQYEPVRDVAW